VEIAKEREREREREDPRVGAMPHLDGPHYPLVCRLKSRAKRKISSVSPRVPRQPPNSVWLEGVHMKVPASGIMRISLCRNQSRTYTELREKDKEIKRLAEKERREEKK